MSDFWPLVALVFATGIVGGFLLHFSRSRQPKNPFGWRTEASGAGAGVFLVIVAGSSLVIGAAICWTCGLDPRQVDYREIFATAVRGWDWNIVGGVLLVVCVILLLGCWTIAREADSKSGGAGVGPAFIVGLLIVGYYLMFHDVSVPTSMGRVVNLGLMHDRLVGLIIGFGLILFSALARR